MADAYWRYIEDPAAMPPPAASPRQRPRPDYAVCLKRLSLIRRKSKKGRLLLRKYLRKLKYAFLDDDDQTVIRTLTGYWGRRPYYADQSGTESDAEAGDAGEAVPPVDSDLDVAPSYSEAAVAQEAFPTEVEAAVTPAESEEAVVAVSPAESEEAVVDDDVGEAVAVVYLDSGEEVLAHADTQEAVVSTCAKVVSSADAAWEVLAHADAQEGVIPAHPNAEEVDSPTVVQRAVVAVVPPSGDVMAPVVVPADAESVASSDKLLELQLEEVMGS